MNGNRPAFVVAYVELLTEMADTEPDPVKRQALRWAVRTVESHDSMVDDVVRFLDVAPEPVGDDDNVA